MTDPLPGGREIKIFPDKLSLMEGGAEFMAAQLGANEGGVRVALSGGHTPIPFYARLSAPTLRAMVNWRKVRFTMIDERCVPPDHEESNFRMARETLLGPLDIPADRFIRFRGEDPPEKAAEKAHKMLLAWAQRVPLFDLVFLGLGEDGHVASLFPADRWPDFGTRLAAATRHPSGQNRITLTPRALRSTRATMLLVTGENKAGAVRDTLAATEPSPRHPATMVLPPGGKVVWMIDEAAAAELPPVLREAASSER